MLTGQMKAGAIVLADRYIYSAIARAILRIADALDRSHDNRVQAVRCTRDGQVVHLQLRSAHDCDQEILAAEQKCDMFEQAFNCKMTFSKRALAKRA